MKFSVKLTVAGDPGKPATSYRRDFEAESPEDAARLAGDYWDANWEGSEIITESWIYVYGYRLESNQPKEVASFHAHWDTDGYRQARKAIEALVSIGIVPESESSEKAIRAIEQALNMESAKVREFLDTLVLRRLVHVMTWARNRLDASEGPPVCRWTAGPANSMAKRARS